MSKAMAFLKSTQHRLTECKLFVIIARVRPEILRLQSCKPFRASREPLQICPKSAGTFFDLTCPEGMITDDKQINIVLTDCVSTKR